MAGGGGLLASYNICLAFDAGEVDAVIQKRGEHAGEDAARGTAQQRVGQERGDRGPNDQQPLGRPAPPRRERADAVREGRPAHHRAGEADPNGDEETVDHQ
jgi:hypothetical protein